MLMEGKVDTKEMALLTGRVFRCNRAKKTCDIKTCDHYNLHEFELGCTVKCPDHISALCIQMYGGEKVTGIGWGESRLLRMCRNCGEIQETQHMRYDDILHGWLCQACRPREVRE